MADQTDSTDIAARRASRRFNPARSRFRFASLQHGWNAEQFWALRLTFTKRLIGPVLLSRWLRSRGSPNETRPPPPAGLWSCLLLVL